MGGIIMLSDENVIIAAMIAGTATLDATIPNQSGRECWAVSMQA
jgi:hypothetical protein